MSIRWSPIPKRYSFTMTPSESISTGESLPIIFFTTLASTLGFLYLIRNRKKIIKTLQFD